MNILVAALSWMAMGKPTGGPAAGVLGASLNARQWELVEELKARVAGVCRPGVSLDIPGGGLASLTSALLESGQIAYTLEGADRKLDTAGPLQLDASSLSLPLFGAKIEMDETVLPRSLAQVLRAEAVFDKNCVDMSIPLPGACHAYQAAAPILAKLWDARLLRPCARSALEVFDGAEVRAGLFGVAKAGSEKMRVIIDRRRRNHLERGLPQVVWEHDVHHAPGHE